MPVPETRNRTVTPQGRYNRECRLARAWMLRHQPAALRAIVRQVEREGAKSRVYGDELGKSKRKVAKKPTFTVLRLTGDEKESNGDK